MRFDTAKQFTRTALLGAALVACSAPGIRWDQPQQLEDPEPSGPPELRAYKETYYQSLGDHFVAHLTEPQLEERIAQSRVLYLGDRHDDEELHDWMLALIARLGARGLPLVVGLEAVGEQDEVAVQDYLTGDMQLEELRRRLVMRWPGSWLDNPQVDGDFYATVLKQARDAQTPVFALEPIPRGDLLRRDAVMAANIERAARMYLDAVVVVIVGQAHLLGGDRLVERVRLPWVAISARLSVSLRRRAQEYPSPGNARYFVTDQNVVVRPRR